MTEEFDCVVVMWKYGDGSGCGVARAFDTQDAADEFIDFMTEHCDGARTFFSGAAKMVFTNEDDE